MGRVGASKSSVDKLPLAVLATISNLKFALMRGEAGRGGREKWCSGMPRLALVSAMSSRCGNRLVGA
jgi:hypothetical protein